MSLIVIGSPKGGVGKSTTALVLGQVLAENGHKTSILEFDENQPLASWQERAHNEGYNKPLKIMGGFKDSNSLLETAQIQSSENEFTIIDFPGMAEMGFLLLAQISDIVLIPMKETYLDAEQAQKLVSMLRMQEKISNSKINYRIVFSAVENIRTKEARAIQEALTASNTPFLTESLPRRAAFSAIFSCSCSLYDLDEEVKNPEKIRAVAENFCESVIDSMKENKNA